ncbi:MAG: FliM/FliN family flagellar motor C-terminal domain-containing protein [Planctomycetia bacterium]|nr:FliM/FliN family flagellar motor C-terminal domain-containing protein [Planctomycetia bacterium]
MSEFVPSIAPEVVAACQAGAGETAPALSRSLDSSIEVTVGEAAVYDPASPDAAWAGPGLAVLLTVGSEGAIALLSESSGLLPGWYQKPDATGTSKLATLAQELGMLLLPEQFMPDDFRAAYVPHLGEALARASVAQGSGLVPLTLTSGEKQGILHLLWPASQPQELFNPPKAPEPAAEPSPPPVVVASPPPAPVEPKPQPVAAPHAPAFGGLPTYTRSLLRIQVPVLVTLAHKRQSLNKVVELRPGAIIQFNKSCEEMLELEVNNQVIAEGECVKTGDKFGLRITAMKPPEERFKTVRKSG